MVASDHAVACGEESQCLSGSPVPMTGAMTTGMPAIRLDSVYRLLLMSTVRLGVIFALTILISSLPRSTGPSWRMIAMPSQMRLIEDHPVQGESYTMFRTVTAMMSDDPLRVCMRVQMALARMGVPGAPTDLYRCGIHESPWQILLGLGFVLSGVVAGRGHGAGLFAGARWITAD